MSSNRTRASDQDSDAERAGGSPPPDQTAGSLSAAAIARAVALVVDLRFSMARLRMLLGDIDG